MTEHRWALFFAGEGNVARIGFHRASFKRNRHDYRQTASRFNVPSPNVYFAIEIPHDYPRLPPMNIASARSLHILLKATKEFLVIPATQFPRRTGKKRVKLLPFIWTPNKDMQKKVVWKEIANSSCLRYFKNVFKMYFKDIKYLQYYYTILPDHKIR